MTRKASLHILITPLIPILSLIKLNHIIQCCCFKFRVSIVADLFEHDNDVLGFIKDRIR